jgi:hypothetical protein
MKIKLFLLVFLGPSTPLWAYSEPQRFFPISIAINALSDETNNSMEEDSMHVEPNSAIGDEWSSQEMSSDEALESLSSQDPGHFSASLNAQENQNSESSYTESNSEEHQEDEESTLANLEDATTESCSSDSESNTNT